MCMRMLFVILWVYVCVMVCVLSRAQMWNEEKIKVKDVSYSHVPVITAAAIATMNNNRTESINKKYCFFLFCWLNLNLPLIHAWIITQEERRSTTDHLLLLLIIFHFLFRNSHDPRGIVSSSITLLVKLRPCDTFTSAPGTLTTHRR